MKQKMGKQQLISVIIFSLFLVLGMSYQNIFADNLSEWKTLITKADSLYQAEQYEQAGEVAQQAVQYSLKHFGENHLNTVISVHIVAEYYGDPSIYLQALGLAKRNLGEDHRRTLTIMSELAGLYGDEGEIGEALTLYEQAFEISQQKYGRSDEFSLSVMTSLAQIYQSQGDLEKAEKLLDEAVKSYMALKGAGDEDTLFAKESLAAVYMSQVQFEKSEALYQQVLEHKTQVYGPEDAETVFTKSGLAELYRRMAKYDEAETLFLSVLETLNRITDDQDPELFQVKGNLALLYQDQGLYSKAEPLYVAVWEFDKLTLGEKHPSTIVDLNNLAGLYRLQGFYGKAEEAYLNSVSLIIAVYGEKHPETISIINNLALLYENQGLYDKSEPLFKRALKNSNAVLGKTHPTTLALMNNLASLYESQGIFEKSEPLYLQTIMLSQSKYGENHPRTIASINNLGYLYLIQKRYAEAEPRFIKVLTQWEGQLGERHQKTLKAINNLGRVYHKTGKIELAEEMLSRALRLRKEVLGEKHPDVVRSMVDLSALYITKKQYGEAEKLLLDTITLAEEILGEKHQYTFEALNNLSELYKITGNDKELAVRQKVFDRRTEFFNQVLWAAGENTRQSYVELHKPEQDAFLSLLAKKKNKQAAKLALHVSLQRKGLLLKISSEIQKIMKMTDSPILKTKAKNLNDKRKELASLTLSGPTSETPEEFRKKVSRLENELYDLQAELGRVSKIYQMTSREIEVDNVFENLETDDVLVDFIAYNDNGMKIMAVVAQSDPESCFVWWECQNNRIEIVPLGDLENVTKVVSIYRETIQDEDAEEEELEETAHSVYESIWQPLESFIGDKKSIYIVPDSVLHLLPFDAVTDEDGRYLLESKDIKVLSSSRDLVVASLPDADGDFIILAGPDYDLEDTNIRSKKIAIQGKRSAVGKGMRVASHGLRSLSFDPLDGAELEGKNIKKVSDAFEKLEGAENEGISIKAAAQKGNRNATIYIKRFAEEQELRNVTEPPKILHLATHGFFLQAEERLKKRLLSLNRGGIMLTPPPGDNPLLRAGLAFAGINSNAPYLGEIDTDNDGVLTAMEVLALPLSGTQLVVLSACETGVGEIHAGEGVYGLRRAFQEAGVKSVVNSLWPVSDEGTRLLMTLFYENMFKGIPAREALKQAQLAMLDTEWNHPYYWGAFVLVERRFSASN